MQGMKRGRTSAFEKKMAILPLQLELLLMPPGPSNHKPLSPVAEGLLHPAFSSSQLCPICLPPHHSPPPPEWGLPVRPLQRPSASLGSLRSPTAAGQDVLSRSLSHLGEGRGREDPSPSAQLGGVISTRQGGLASLFPYRGLPRQCGWGWDVQSLLSWFSFRSSFCPPPPSEKHF